MLEITICCAYHNNQERNGTANQPSANKVLNESRWEKLRAHYLKGKGKFSQLAGTTTTSEPLTTNCSVLYTQKPLPEMGQSRASSCEEGTERKSCEEKRLNFLGETATCSNRQLVEFDCDVDEMTGAVVVGK